MAEPLNVLALSEEVSRDSESGKLARDLLSQGQTLYGKNALFPTYLERITPDGRKTLGRISKGKFVPFFCLLTDISKSL
ncbi:hypothetical protein Q3O60_14930 [Alkalimonas collagenimarina]|uniref:Uncharacterized protein n=1 Tax=Alkalimonas collagenimarina TaxID=400390 RepID=A0ABT9H2E8_9GAMM|nr:hypothetical protein [Alkalimonas collagenimarina]MDP4537485.1 hypothetical protein [Alkalimonas collagenimarina]